MDTFIFIFYDEVYWVDGNPIYPSVTLAADGPDAAVLLLVKYRHCIQQSPHDYYDLSELIKADRIGYVRRRSQPRDA